MVVGDDGTTTELTPQQMQQAGLAITENRGTTAISSLGSYQVTHDVLQTTQLLGGDVRLDDDLVQLAAGHLLLDHLPAGYSSARPAWVYDDSPTGFVGAELRYRPSEGTDGDLVRVSLWSRDDPMTCGSREHCVELPGANGDRVFLAWELQEPEEDPGLFSVWVNRPGEVVYGLVAEPVLKTDPRSLTTGTTVDLLRAVITDERLRLLTTADVVAASEQVQRWKKQ